MKSCATASWVLIADLQREWGWCSRSRARGCAAMRTLEKPLHAEPRAGGKVQRTAADAGRPCGCGGRRRSRSLHPGCSTPCVAAAGGGAAGIRGTGAYLSCDRGGQGRSRGSSPWCRTSLRCGAPEVAPLGCRGVRPLPRMRHMAAASSLVRARDEKLGCSTSLRWRAGAESKLEPRVQFVLAVRRAEEDGGAAVRRA